MQAEDRTSQEAGVAVPEHLARDLDRDDLSRLVREVNDSGVSYSTMESRARQAGYSMSRSQFQKIAVGTTRTAPDEEHLYALAAGLQKPLRVVQRAAARQYLAYENTELSGFGDDVRVIVAHLAGMDPDDVRRWRAMMEADERARAERQEGATS